jgi:hypothetical protein
MRRLENIIKNMNVVVEILSGGYEEFYLIGYNAL